MKKFTILPLLVILISFSSVHAQITKGSLFLGGNVSFNTTTTSTESNSVNNDQAGFSFSPVIGKAIEDNLIIGGSLIYSSNNSVLHPSSPYQYGKDKGYGAGFFLRKYKPIGKGFYLFLEGSLGGRYDKSNFYPDFSNLNNNYKKTSFNLNVSPGISYAISKKLHLEIGLDQLIYAQYSNEKGDRSYFDGTKYETSSFNIGSSLSRGLLGYTSFGFRFLLGK